MKKKLIIKSIAALVILVACLVVTGIVTVPKWVTGHNPQTLQTGGFSDIERDSVDVLVLGSCQSYQGFNPAVFWKNTGLTSYVLASPDQRMYTTCYYLQYALRTQSPKVVLLDALYLIDENTPSSALDSKAYVPMSLCAEKLALSDTSFEYCYQGDKGTPQYLLDRAGNAVKTVFPVLAFHARTDYTENDLLYLAGHDFGICFNGGIPFYYTRDISPYAGYMDDRGETAQIDGSAREWFAKIKELCDSGGITPVLYKTPSPSKWSAAAHDAVAQLAREAGVEFVDFNLDEYRDAFDYTSDFHTAWKLNAAGMEKQTALLGDYLTESFGDLFDRQKNTGTAQTWDALYEKYAAYNAGKEFIFLED